MTGARTTSSHPRGKPRWDAPKLADLPVSSAVEPDDSDVAATLLSAAVLEMATKGYHATSVRSIAALANVSLPALYHYFGSKHDLLAEIMSRGNAHLYERAQAAIAGAGPGVKDRFLALVTLFVERHLESQRESFLGTTELRSLEPEARQQVVAMRDKTQRLFYDVVSEGAAAGVFTTPFPKEAARAIITMCTSVAGWYREGGALTRDEVIERYQRLCLDTVGWPQPAARPPAAARLPGPAKTAKTAKDGT
jgi:AcrR family transcriptional regulator